MIDPAKLDLMIRLLPPELGEILSREIEPPWKQRARRLAARDAAILACFDQLPGMAPTPAARRIEQALGRYLAGFWLIERNAAELPMTGGLPDAIRKLARANGGAALGVRQLLNVRAGCRG